ncbi:MAG TPA: R3H domain-containing nucleic acid-binding protein [Dehalococcoidales bacterium]|nr:R3H domain-containing nucleic acid-binding protein [Dehalococcoidales bacterium]
MQNNVNDDLSALLEIFPQHIKVPLSQQKDIDELVEVVMDLGRSPEARFFNREIVIIPQEVSELDIGYVTSHISRFGDDNRAGIERTLHRISAIRNRKGMVVGLTCRVGRAVFGTIKIIQDLVESGKSILLMGRPGVGKTTMLREIARVLADDSRKRVVIVDSSNEIGGDGDIPHSGIGHARRMQVTTPALQHAVMIEAVENHMPQVIVIDEIGTELEARAARTIAERGVQLVGTAHGNTLENLIVNPTLSDLIGGIQTVTISDEEAKRRGTQKSILERTAPPTFGIVVEIQERTRVAIHKDVGEAVDRLLRGQPEQTEERWLDEKGEIQTVMKAPEVASLISSEKKPAKGKKIREEKNPRLYLFGVNRARLEQMAHDMHINLDIVNNASSANFFITSKAYYRNRPQKMLDAEASNLPVYVLKSNTPNQIRQLLNTIYPDARRPETKTDPVAEAVEEAHLAVEQIKEGDEVVELNPQSAYIRRLQHMVAEQCELPSDSTGRDPNRRVRIFKKGSNI